MRDLASIKFKSEFLNQREFEKEHSELPCRILGNGFRMGFRNIPNFIALLLLINIGKIKGLLLHGNSICKFK